MTDEYILKETVINYLKYHSVFKSKSEIMQEIAECKPADVVSASAYNQVMLEMDTAGWIIAILCMMLIERIRGNKDD